MKVIKYLLIVMLLIVIHSCKYNCYGFLEPQLRWVPYDMGVTLKYTDNIDTIEFSVIDFYKTEPSSFRGLAMDYECDSKSYYLTSKNDKGYQIREEYNDGFDWGMKVQITENDSFEFNIPGKTSFSNLIKVAYKQDSLIKETNYSEVFVVTKDTINMSPGIGYIIKAANYGIIEFYDFKSKRKWNLINN